ncbi:MAG: cyclic nucleotide-binding domain-containing protein [Myxococcota bacterium]
MDPRTDPFQSRGACHVAKTEDEREAIYRQRYEIYVLGKGLREGPGVDHASGRLVEPDDEGENTTLYYIGTPDDVVGSLKVRSWRAGECPDSIRRTYRCDRLEGLDAMPGFDMTALMIRERSRGGQRFLTLTIGAISDTLVRSGAGYLLADCAPGLLRLYRRMGLRPYGAPPVLSDRGILLPLVALTCDLGHLRSVSSPLLPVAQAAIDAGAVQPVPVDHLVAQIDGAKGVEVDPASILAEVDRLLGESADTFFHRLPEATRKLLFDEGMVVDADAGTTIVAQGIVDRDIYVVLEGLVEVRQGERLLATLGPGDLFGEIAFFHDAGARTASVNAASDVRIFILRHQFLSRLKLRDPVQACEVLWALGSLLAARAARS